MMLAKCSGIHLLRRLLEFIRIKSELVNDSAILVYSSFCNPFVTRLIKKCKVLLNSFYSG